MVFYPPLVYPIAQLEGPSHRGLVVSCHHLYYRTIISFERPSTPRPLPQHSRRCSALRRDPLRGRRRRPETNCRILIRCVHSLLSEADGLIGFRPLTSSGNRARGDPVIIIIKRDAPRKDKFSTIAVYAHTISINIIIIIMIIYHICLRSVCCGAHEVPSDQVSSIISKP